MGRRLMVLVVGAAVSGLLVYGFWPEPAPEPWPDYEVTPAGAASITQTDLIGRHLAATLALAPAQGFPATLAWHPVLEIGEQGGFSLANLLHAHPLLFLQLCAERFDQDVRGYTCAFVKKERIDGKLFPPGKSDYEVIHVACREQPFSVFFAWKEHQRKAARASMSKAKTTASCWPARS